MCFACESFEWVEESELFQLLSTSVLLFLLWMRFQRDRDRRSWWCRLWRRETTTLEKHFNEKNYIRNDDLCCFKEEIQKTSRSESNLVWLDTFYLLNSVQWTYSSISISTQKHHKFHADYYFFQKKKITFKDVITDYKNVKID